MSDDDKGDDTVDMTNEKFADITRRAGEAVEHAMGEGVRQLRERLAEQAERVREHRAGESADTGQ